MSVALDVCFCFWKVEMIYHIQFTYIECLDTEFMQGGLSIEQDNVVVYQVALHNVTKL